mgnify:CR=1 FL=1
MRIAIGSDHGGYVLKQELLTRLQDLGHEWKDFGCYSEESVDYPDYAIEVAHRVASGEFDRGILLCGTGIGMCITANKVPGIRAATVHDLFSAEATRAHNDSNILTMGGRVVDSDQAEKIARIWLSTPFEGGRHARRLGKIEALEHEIENGAQVGKTSR